LLSTAGDVVAVLSDLVGILEEMLLDRITFCFTSRVLFAHLPGLTVIFPFLEGLFTIV
jgi:hypothetical protein